MILYINDNRHILKPLNTEVKYFQLKVFHKNNKWPNNRDMINYGTMNYLSRNSLPLLPIYKIKKNPTISLNLEEMSS